MTIDAGFHIDESLCVECGQCRRFCPIVEAIYIDERYQHVINNDLCTGCGLCEAFCPIPKAIFSIKSSSTTIEPYHREYLRNLRRVVWRGKWLFHDHPLLGIVTYQARQSLHAHKRRYFDEFGASRNPAAMTASKAAATGL